MQKCSPNVNVNKDDKLCSNDDYSTKRRKSLRLRKYKSKEINKKANSIVRKKITSLPVEIILKIFNFLPKSSLRNLQNVNKHFQQLSRDPILWKVYKIHNSYENYKSQRRGIIEELNHMIFLEKCILFNNVGCDEILNQISLNNRNLKEIHIRKPSCKKHLVYTWTHCLRSTILTKLLQRCRHLHTIIVDKCDLRGLKLYKILGTLGLKMKRIAMPASRIQFRTFIENSTYIKEKDRQLLFNLTAYDREREYVLLRYESHTIRIDYNNRYPEIMYVNISASENYQI